MFIVYETTCLVNNKIYIGVHETDNPDIFDGYIGNSINIFTRKYAIENPKFPFHYAVKKYGIHNFKRKTLFIYKTKEDAYKKEAEIVTEEFIKNPNNYNVCIGGNRPRVKTQTLFQFDYQGNLINSYDSVIIGAKMNNIVYNTLLTAIYNKRGTNGFYWSYDSKIDISEYGYKKKLHYYIYDQDGNFIKEFIDSKEILEFLNTNSGNLSRAIKLTNKISGYFISTEKFKKLQINVTKLSGKLNRYTLDGKYIDSFKTVKEAKEKLNLKLCSISQAIKLNRQCNGYRWTRTDNPTPTIQVNYNN